MEERMNADYIEITTNIGCRNACVYCPQETLINSYKKISDITLMSYELFTGCIDKVPQKTIILFSGLSEAWLNPDCTKMLLYANEKKHKISIYTTMAGMSMEDIKTLKNIPLREFHLHLPTNENYENIIVDNNYLNKLKALTESKIDIVYSFFGISLNKSLVPLLKEKKVIKRYFHSRAGNTSLKQIYRPKPKRGKIDCELISGNGPVLLPNGDAILCCMDYSLRYILGNLTKNAWRDLFDSDTFLRVKRGRGDISLDTICRHCVQSKDVSLWAKFYNKYLPALRKIKTFDQIKRVFKKKS